MSLITYDLVELLILLVGIVWEVLIEVILSDSIDNVLLVLVLVALSGSSGIL